MLVHGTVLVNLFIGWNLGVFDPFKLLFLLEKDALLLVERISSFLKHLRCHKGVFLKVLDLVLKFLD